MVTDSLRQGSDVGGILLFVDIIADVRGIIDRSEFTTQTLFHGVRVVEGIHEAVHHIRLLLREIYHLGEVHIRPAHRGKAVAPLPYPLHSEPSRFECVKIPEQGPAAEIQTLAYLIQRVIDVTGQVLHKAQHPLHFRLVHILFFW